MLLAVGPLPDSLKFTSDCRMLIVAIEGEPRNINGQVVDPEGGVNLIDFGTDPSTGTPDVTFVNFASFNSR